jgi:hypothetical protein
MTSIDNQHTGIGQNDPGRRQLQIGENTIEVSDLHIKIEEWGILELTNMQSFLSAMNLGASYVEVRKLMGVKKVILK